MALRNPNTNLQFLRLREGKFYIGKDTETPYGELYGLITGMRYKDEEYEGAPLRKLILTIVDGDETYQLGLNVESQNYSSLVSFLRNVDLTKPITLHPKIEAGNKDGRDFKRHSILVSQNGTYSKGFFTKDKPNGLPAWKTVKVGKKTVVDKTDYLQFLEEFVTRNYIPVVTKGGTTVSAPVDERVDTSKDEMENGNEETLPWDE